MRSHLVAGLDIGSTKTVAAIAEVTAEAQQEPAVRILGVGQARTSGIRREIVTDLEATTESVRKALKEAELMAGVSVNRVCAGIAGEHVEGRVSRGVVAVGAGEIAAGDVDRVHEVARAIMIPGDREVIHAIPQEYVVDVQDGIRDPVGMAGTRLEAEVFIVTGAAPHAQNIRKAVDRAGYSASQVVFEPLASAMATLSEDEREIGVALVELGADSTEILIYQERKIRHLSTLPWGGTTVTNDVAQGLSLPYAQAVQIKERWGAARADMVDPHDTFEVPAAGPGQTRHIARELLAHIIEQRVDEIFGLIAERLAASGYGDRLGAGVVLTGGGASLAGVVELAENSFVVPVRCGIPGEGLGGLVDSVRRPKFASVAGLVLYGAHQLFSDTNAGSAVYSGSSVNGVFQWMRDWLTDFF